MRRHVVIPVMVLTAFSLVYSQQMVVKDSDAHVLMQVNDEGAVGSITMPSGTAPSVKTNKLYNVSGSLYWNGTQLGQAGVAGTDKQLQYNDAGSLAGANIYYDHSTSNTGLGTISPEFRLHLDNDGGILAEGTFESGTTLGSQGSGTRLIWYPRKAAFRAGRVSSTQWDHANTGDYSNASGWNTTASGLASAAMNYATEASGTCAIAMGSATTAPTYACLAIGRFNVGGGVSPTSWFATDPVFEIGIGSGAGSEANAVTVLKNGYMGIGDATPDFPLEVEGKIAVSDSQIIYMPDQSLYKNSLFIGTGGSQLSHGSGAQGQYNTALGMEALSSLETGWNNTACGWKTMGSHVSGYGNTAYGIAALLSNTSGHGNCTIGGSADSYNETGSNNTIIGTQAGQGTSAHSKSGCVLIGYQAGFYETGDNRLYIDNSNTGAPLIWGDFANNRLVISGNASHNTSNRTFFVNGSAGGTGDWYNDSDARLKKNVHTIPHALDKVLRLRGVNFEWRDQERREAGMRMGFIAQEAEHVVPETVSCHEDHYAMQYASITALLVEAIKEQQVQIEMLKAKIK